jgi:hypothetical protein
MALQMKSDPAPGVDLEAARGLAKSIMLREDAQGQTLRLFSDICRRAGAIEQARDLLELSIKRDGITSPSVRWLRAALGGEFIEATAEGIRPAPFLRERSFLSQDLRDRLFAMAIDALPHFRIAEVDRSQGDESGYATARRASLVLFDTKRLGALFLPALRELMTKRGYLRFGLDSSTVKKFELQATIHNDGAFFSAHSDTGNGSSKNRLVSFVYYMHAWPKAFSGGDLLIYDSDPAQRRYSTTKYTRVIPEDNSIIIFPSNTMHEVEGVRSASQNLADGRLTLNGWMRR